MKNQKQTSITEEKNETLHTMSLLDLLDPPTARNTDPWTSHYAASFGQASSLRLSILAALVEEPLGLATFEMATLIGVTRDTISPHMKPLEKLGLVKRSGATIVNPATRSKARSEVWVLTDKFYESNIKPGKLIRSKICPMCRRHL